MSDSIQETLCRNLEVFFLGCKLFMTSSIRDVDFKFNGLISARSEGGERVLRALANAV